MIPYDDNWCRGKINGKDGYVPKTYITEKPHTLVIKKATTKKDKILIPKQFIYQDGLKEE